MVDTCFFRYKSIRFRVVLGCRGDGDASHTSRLVQKILPIGAIHRSLPLVDGEVKVGGVRLHPPFQLEPHLDRLGHRGTQRRQGGAVDCGRRRKSTRGSHKEGRLSHFDVLWRFFCERRSMHQAPSSSWTSVSPSASLRITPTLRQWSGLRSNEMDPFVSGEESGRSPVWRHKGEQAQHEMVLRQLPNFGPLGGAVQLCPTGHPRPMSVLPGAHRWSASWRRGRRGFVGSKGHSPTDPVLVLGSVVGVVTRLRLGLDPRGRQDLGC